MAQMGVWKKRNKWKKVFISNAQNMEKKSFGKKGNKWKKVFISYTPAMEKNTYPPLGGV